MAASVLADAKIEGDCFLAGLLHDVGKLLLAARAPQLYTEAITLGHGGGNPAPRGRAAGAWFLHADVGALLG